MGALESRGVLRKMSDMLEMLVKRMDVLARLENSTDSRKGEEARFSPDRSVAAGMVPSGIKVPLPPNPPGSVYKRGSHTERSDPCKMLGALQCHCCP